jgi:gliding motility-associated transport system permease protein
VRGLVQKELLLFFSSFLFYALTAIFLVLCGFLFYTNLDFYVRFGGMNLVRGLWQYQLFDMRERLLVLIPLVTMRAFAEERRLGTLELLVTYPVSDRAIVAAKLTACLIVVLLLIGATALYPVWVYRVQPFDVTPLVAGYLGLALLAAACASYGLFVSALTESQVLAGFLTAMPLLLLWLLSWNEAANAQAAMPILQALSLFNHFQPFAVGLVELRDVFYFTMLAGVFVWATLRVLEARQWRGRR